MKLSKINANMKEKPHTQEVQQNNNLWIQREKKHTMA